ncbi:MAG: 30S ribosomal protein S17 [Candidatus Omnitrophica bacterium]|nr:30S ribosomal protein S17 [Candidatus Omnitrophota bacterium]MCM8826862.1 30S ribosomal protein S17 [Candidatus Omnitrophota bacterium]
MDKTIVVKVRRSYLHPVYKKTIIKYKKFKVHDPKELAKVNDRVKVIECRPYSKDKHFRLLEIIK